MNAYPDIIDETNAELAKFARDVARTRQDDIGNYDAMKKLVEAIDTAYTVTLAAGAATTVVSNARCKTTSHISLMPKTVTAAAGFATGSLYVVVGNATFTIHHDNTADIDRIFSYTVTG